MTNPSFKSLNLPKADKGDLDGYLQKRGVPVLSKPQEPQPESHAVSFHRSRPAKVHEVHLAMPDYLAKALRIRAVEQGCTIRFLILEALQKTGWELQPHDLQEDGRRRVNR